MDLLLTHGYFLAEDLREQQIMKPYPPLGILYLTSHLRAKGLQVEVFDSTFSTRDDLLALLRNTTPAVLGIYANLMTRHSVVRLVSEARKYGWKIVVGGPEPGAYVEEYLSAGADAVVLGEGECTLEELVPALKGSLPADLERIPGIAYRATDGQVRRTAPRPLIANLDNQPWPSRESIHVEKYLEAWRNRHGTGSVSLITARGCPYDCRWCSHAVYGKTHRRRSVFSVVDELEWVLDRYSPDMLWIADDVFTIHHGWLSGFAKEMQRRGLNIPFECISRADRINAEVADLLASLQCFRIWIGSESGSQRILDAMERGVTVEQVGNAISLCKSRGIQTGMFLMWGYEGEELEDIEQTVRHVKRTQPDTFLTTVSYPIKGTPYFDEVSDRVTMTPGWEEGSDRDFRIRGRHSRAFYAYADKLLKAEVEIARIQDERGSQTESRRSELQQSAALAREGLRHSYDDTEA